MGFFLEPVPLNSTNLVSWSPQMATFLTPQLQYQRMRLELPLRLTEASPSNNREVLLQPLSARFRSLDFRTQLDFAHGEETSGPATPGNPGESGLGTIAQGYLEGSNVSVVEEIVQMVTGQRAYEANSKVIQTADQLLSLAINVKR